MPARIVLVHDDVELLQSMKVALAGYDVAAFDNPMTALAALQSAKLIDLLITGLRFPAGQPNGVSLALMATRMRPLVKVLIAAPPEDAHHADDVGELLPYPIDLPYLVTIVRGLIGGPEARRQPPG